MRLRRIKKTIPKKKINDAKREPEICFREKATGCGS
jgi:hypothetical protein